MRNWNLERSSRLAEEAQNRQIAINEATSDLVATADIDGFLISLNSAGFDLLGLEKNTDISQLRIADFYTEECAKNLAKYEIPNAILHNVSHSEMTLISKSGEKIPSSQVLLTHKDQDQNFTFFSIILRDIRALKEAENERKNLLDQLHHAKKMETVGRLAGGIAHDFNNILTVIVGYAELGLLNMPTDQQSKNEFEIILDSAEKATRLSSQLLSFSSKQRIEPTILDLNEIIMDSEKLVSSLLGDEIRVEISLDESLWPIKMDRTQLEQTILNMAVNAKDALDSNGQFIIKTQNISLSKKDAIKRSLKISGDYALLTISDTGSGIDDEVIEHIFEPFYTTKERGKGTGLGLATVYGAITQNNGCISVSSKIDEGTSFNIYLPRSEPFSN